MTPLAEPRGVPAAVQGVRAHLRRRAALAAALGGGVGIGGVLALAWVLAGSGGWAQGTPAPLLLDVALVAILSALAGWVGGDRHRLADARVARSMEASAGLAEGTVEGALQLARAVPAGVSGSLAALAERGVAARLDQPPARLAGALGADAHRRSRRAGALLAVAAPLVALLLVAAPARSMGAWAGLGRPLRLLARPTLPPLEVSPGDAEVLRGSPLTVTVRAPGRAEVTLHWQAAGDVARTRTMAAEDSEARFVFDAVNSSTEYAATTADGAESARYRLTPVDPLLISDVSIELAFPSHTGRAPEEYRGEAPPLVVPAGTRFRFEGRATRPLAAAGLEREEDGLRVPLAAAGMGFAGGWLPARGGLYRWRFRDLEGGEAEITPAPLNVTVVPDSAPAIRFAFPAADTVLPMSLRQPLVLEVRDDYGVGAMELVAYRVTSLGERLPPVVLRTDLGGTRAVLARPLMDLTGWGLLPGDTVRYFARALDNAPSPNAAQTREYVLRMPDAAELRRGAQRDLEDLTGRLQELSDRAQRASETARNLEREAEGRRPQAAADRAAAQRGRRGAADRAGFEERERLRRALEEQRAMAAEAERARAEIEAIEQALRQAGASDPQLQADLAELQQLLEEAASPELRERLREMAERIENTDPRQIRSSMEELTAQQERFREQLEESLEQLRRAAAEQDFRATTEDARELAQRQEALADALQEGDRSELREQQQQEMAADAAALAERMEQLERRLEALSEPDAEKGVDAAEHEVGEAREAMERAREAMRRGAEAQPRPGQGDQPSRPRPAPDAAEQARQAAAGLERAADQLQAAQEDMSSERAQALQDAVARTAEDALTLARQQAQIRQDMRGAGEQGMTELRGEQSALLQGLRNMQGNLDAAAGGETPQLGPMSARLGEAVEAAEETLRSMAGERGNLPTPQAASENAVAALNGLAESALAAGEAISQSSAQGGSLEQQLERLAQQQGRLNNRAGQVVPLQLGQQAMEEQLQGLAQDQAQVAGDLHDLARRPGAEGQALGDLQALAEEAGQLAGRLAGGRLDPETRERQERLFHRLLDAGRALEREEFSDERESRAAGTFERGEVLPLGDEALGVLRYALPSAAQLMRLSPAERELVLRYFDRLNRARGPAPAGTPADQPAAPAAGPPALQSERR